MSNKSIEHTFHDAVTGAATGADMTVNDLSDLSVYIFGTSSSRTVQFFGSFDGTNFVPMSGVNSNGLANAVSTTGTAEIWKFSVSGLKKFRANLSAVSGGNVSVKGRATA